MGPVVPSCLVGGARACARLMRVRAHDPRSRRRPWRPASILPGLVLTVIALACGPAAAHGPLDARIAELTREIERTPGGAALRAPLLVLAMRWYALRDRL